jgi:GDSL-like lipase/acylhydrolase family protein
LWSAPRLPRLYAAALGALLGLALLGLGEGYCRLFTRINFLDSSPNLFVADRFGWSRGNVVNGRATAFGHTVYTDGNGFRIDPDFPDPGSARAVLFLGDSVGFGSGVDEEDSALGRLRRARPGWRVYNASVIGYGVRDYVNVLDAFLPAHPEVKAVYVLMCLNDIHDLSDLAIQERLGHRAPVAPASGQESGDLVQIAKRVAVLQAANDWLRSRSKLYLFLRGLASDSSMRFFLHDLELYRARDGDFQTRMALLAAMRARLRAAGIPFKVVVLPYEVQLRAQNADFMLPQRMICGYLSEHGVDYIDATAAFRDTGAPSDALYLYEDPMHFSPRGHGVLAGVLLKELP